MGKSVSSKVARWPGFVVLADPMTFGQVIGFKDALEASREYETDGLRRRKARLPGVLMCVERWQLANFPEEVTVENFPASPLVEAANLIDWLVDEIYCILTEEEEVPKG